MQGPFVLEPEIQKRKQVKELMSKRLRACLRKAMEEETQFPFPWKLKSRRRRAIGFSSRTEKSHNSSSSHTEKSHKIIFSAESPLAPNNKKWIKWDFQFHLRRNGFAQKYPKSEQKNTKTKGKNNYKKDVATFLQLYAITHIASHQIIIIYFHKKDNNDNNFQTYPNSKFIYEILPLVSWTLVRSLLEYKNQ